MLNFPTAFGFAFWLVNPIFVLFAVAWALRAASRRMDAVGWLTMAMLSAHFCATLMHKSMGGVQFGTRYLCDLIPAMYSLWVAYDNGFASAFALRTDSISRFSRASAAVSGRPEAVELGMVGYAAPRIQWLRWVTIAVMTLGLALNLYGAWYFHMLVG